MVTRINENISSPSTRAKVLLVANYYLYNMGGNISTVAKAAFGIDIDAVMAKVNTQLITVRLASIQELSKGIRSISRF